MKKDSDNIIQLPTSGNQGQRVVTEKVNPQAIMEASAQSRINGMRGLEDKVDLFDRPRAQKFEPHVEDRFRDSENALKHTLTHLEGLNIAVDAIGHDCIQMMKALESLDSGMFKISAHLQTLLQCLTEKGVIEDEEMRKIFEKIMKEASEAAKESPAE